LIIVPVRTLSVENDSGRNASDDAVRQVVHRTSQKKRAFAGS